jgi:hypothetical protein
MMAVLGCCWDCKEEMEVVRQCLGVSVRVNEKSQVLVVVVGQCKMKERLE